MTILPTDLPEVIVIEPVVHRDPRGFFLETWSEGRYRDAGIAWPIVQTNHSSSGPRTLRGLHVQARHPQGKLVRVVEGAVLDVAVDVRPRSATFRRWVAVELSAANHRQLWIPPGFAHGFAVLGERAQVEYGCTAYYDPNDDVGIAWNDPDLAVAWPYDDPVLSAKDAAAPRLAETIDRLRVL